MKYICIVSTFNHSQEILPFHSLEAAKEFLDKVPKDPGTFIGIYQEIELVSIPIQFHHVHAIKLKE